MEPRARDRGWASPEAARARATELLTPARFFLLFHAWEGLRLMAEAIQARARLAKREQALARVARTLSRVSELPVKAAAEAELAPAMRELDAALQKATAATRDLNAALQKATAAIQGAKVHHQDTFDDLHITEHLEPDSQSEDRVRRAIVRDALKSLEAMRDQHRVPGEFSAAGLAYFAIAVGLDDPPAEKKTRDELWSAAQIFKRDNVTRWRRILRSVRRGGQEAQKE